MSLSRFTLSLKRFASLPVSTLVMSLVALLALFLLLRIVLDTLLPHLREAFENSSTVARYIHLQHSHQGCINLAEIKVTSYKGGPNLITPQTVVTKSSEYPGAGFNSNFTDRNVDTIIHTACNGIDIPWIRVDMGGMIPIYQIHIVNRKDCCQNRANGIVLSLLDEQQKPVYVSQPIKDKKGRITYVDTPAEYTNMTDYRSSFTWYPPKAEPVYDTPAEDEMPSTMTCRNVSTPWNDEGGGNAVYLDRHNVQCGPDEMLGSFRLVRSGNNQYHYDYSCCRVSIPQGPPVPPTPPLQEDIQNAPKRVASLESEVQQIRKQLQALPSSSPAPVSSLAPSSSPAPSLAPVSSPSLSSSLSPASPQRVDIVPENQVSDTALLAMSENQNSSFLRDLKDVIRNEILSQRATER
jgi:hypothetical protein